MGYPGINFSDNGIVRSTYLIDFTVIFLIQRNLGIIGILVVSAVLIFGVTYFYRGEVDGNQERSRLQRVDGIYRSEFVVLHETNLSGTAVIEPVDGGFEVTVKLNNLTPGARYNTHLHKGTCDQPGGGGIQLNAVTSKNGGEGGSRTRVSYSEINATFDHLVMVHKPNQHHALCADVPNIERLKSTEPPHASTGD